MRVWSACKKKVIQFSRKGTDQERRTRLFGNTDLAEHPGGLKGAVPQLVVTPRSAAVASRVHFHLQQDWIVVSLQRAGLGDELGGFPVRYLAVIDAFGHQHRGIRRTA